MGFNQIFTDPVANVAVAYGTTIASQGKDIVHKEVRPEQYRNCVDGLGINVVAVYSPYIATGVVEFRISG